MKVGVCFPADISHKSVRWVLRSFLESLAAAHTLVFRPHGYNYLRRDRERLMLDSFVRECDIIVGLTNIDVLMARQRLGSAAPFIAVQFGALPRGAFNVRDLLPWLTTNDALLVNCSSDLEIARKFAPDVTAHVLPLSFDDEVFFPVDAAERQALRTKHGFTPEDKIVIYAGRGQLSKNLLTLLRVFQALVPIVPNVHLILAGKLGGLGGGLFKELGVWPVHFAHTVDRLIDKLSLPRERLHLLGDIDGDCLRELYNIADVKVNLTLHHDENFGLTQVEAMACGAPVIGSAWGGLKDTIVEGTSGYQVSVAISSSGVKANWWQAVNKIAGLLTNPQERERLRESCVQFARERYSPAAFQRNLLEIVSSTSLKAEACPRPLEATAFAAEYWSTCAPKVGVMYRPGERSFELYTELMALYCGSTPEDIGPAEPLDDDHILCLAWPLSAGKNGGVRPDDPHCPFELGVPPEFLETFHAVTAVLREKPVITLGELRALLPRTRALDDTLSWMLSVVLFRSRPAGGVSPGDVSGRPDEPLLAMERVDEETVDFIVYDH